MEEAEADYGHLPFRPAGTRRVRYRDGGELKPREIDVSGQVRRIVAFLEEARQEAISDGLEEAPKGFQEISDLIQQQAERIAELERMLPMETVTALLKAKQENERLRAALVENGIKFLQSTNDDGTVDVTFLDHPTDGNIITSGPMN